MEDNTTYFPYNKWQDAWSYLTKCFTESVIPSNSQHFAVRMLKNTQCFQRQIACDIIAVEELVLIQKGKYHWLIKPHLLQLAGYSWRSSAQVKACLMVFGSWQLPITQRKIFFFFSPTIYISLPDKWLNWFLWTVNIAGLILPSSCKVKFSLQMGRCFSYK